MLRIIRTALEAFLAERDRWPLWLPVALGIGVAVYFTLAFEPPLWALAASPLLIVAAWLSRRRWGLFLPVCVGLAVALGFNAGQVDTKLSYTPMLDRQFGPVDVTGRLIATETMPDGVRVTLKNPRIERLDPENTPVKIRVKLNRQKPEDIPPAGSVIHMGAELGPFSDAVMPGAADFRRQAYFRQIGGLGWSFGKAQAAEESPQPGWRDRIGLFFEHARQTLAQHVYARLSGDTAAMTAARLNGEQSGISKPVIAAMRIAGLAHLLSTSGFHVTIMALLIYFPLRAFLALFPPLALRYPIKKWAAFGAIFSAAAYTLLVGSQAATLRSMIMTGIAMLAIIVDRRSAPMRLVMLSAALVMLIDPDALLGPSFQMSFAAVFCLIAYSEKSFGWVAGDMEHFGPEWLRGPFHYLWVIARTSLIATAATTPFAVYHFGTFSFYGFIANMLAIPLTSFWVMPCILLAYVAAPFGWDGWFIDGAGAGINLTIKIAETVASWPWSIFYLPAMPSWVLALITLGGLWLCLWQRNWRWLGLLPVLIGACYPLYTPRPDLIAAGDGSEWAARLDNDTLAVSNLDRDAFAVDEWRQRLGNIPALDISELPQTETQIRCDEIGCVYRKAGHVIALPTMDAAALEDCRKADIVIAPFVIRDCAAKIAISDPEFWRHGAYALTFGKDGRVDIATSRTRRGERPWSPGWEKSVPAKKSGD